MNMVSRFEQAAGPHRGVLHRFFFAVRPPVVLARAMAQSALWFGPGSENVRPDRLHVTLDILDDFPLFPAEAAERLKAAGAAVAAEPFEIVLDQAVGSSRSVALKPQRKVVGLHRLAEAIGEQRSRAGLPLRQDYAFSPHLTLFYRDGRPFTQRIEPIRWEVEEFFLVHSLVGRTRHELIGRWPLAGGAQYSLL